MILQNDESEKSEMSGRSAFTNLNLKFVENNKMD